MKLEPILSFRVVFGENTCGVCLRSWRSLYNLARFEVYPSMNVLPNRSPQRSAAHLAYRW